MAGLLDVPAAPFQRSTPSPKEKLEWCGKETKKLLKQEEAVGGMDT